MNQDSNNLFVGGFADGHRYPARPNETTMIVHEIVSMNDQNFDKAGKFIEHRYDRIRLSGDQKTQILFRAESITTDQVLEKLLANYLSPVQLMEILTVVLDLYRAIQYSEQAHMVPTIKSLNGLKARDLLKRFSEHPNQDWLIGEVKTLE